MVTIFKLNNNRISRRNLEYIIGTECLAILLSEMYSNIVKEIEHYRFHNEKFIFGSTYIYYYKTINTMKIVAKTRL